MIFANVSGGRDSSAMVVRWLESGERLEYVLFCDTGFEFPQMYDYIQKLRAYLKERFAVNFIIIDSRSKIMEWGFENPISRGERKGRYRGIPRRLGMDYCTREAKIKPSRDFVKSISKNAFKNTVLIGYTHAEVERGRVSNLDYAVARYPLHEWHWNERDCDYFLKSRGIANPLYQHFSRTGCYMCPKQSVHSLFVLYRDYPALFQRMIDLEARAKELGAINQTFREKPLTEYARDFKYRQSELFSEDYADDDMCFCK